MKRMMHWLGMAALTLMLLPFTGGAAAQTGGSVNAPNVIESLDVGKAGGNLVLKLVLQRPLAMPPASFSIKNPARLVFDLPAATSKLGYSTKTLNEGALRSLNVVQTEDRTRLVLNLDKNMRHDVRLEGNTLLINLAEVVDGKALATGEAVQRFPGGFNSAGVEVRDVRFRRNDAGAGVVTVDMSASDGVIDLQQKGSSLLVTIKKARLPEGLQRQLDVADFATPISMVRTRANGADVTMEIVPKGQWEHVAFQTDNQFVVEVKPVKEDPNKVLQGSESGYKGELVSLNFQNIPLRDLLYVFADISNLNVVLSDTVTGNVSLKLVDVPWDQALDIVVQQKNLAMRKSGNVLRIAPRDEIATMERAALESRKQISELEPPRTESFQINYQKAEDVQKLLSNKDQPILSKTGAVVVDAYSNRVFVTDIPENLNRARELISLIDQPAKQVLIEARVVEASDKFGRELGVRMNLFNAQPVRAASINGRDINIMGGTNNQWALVERDVPNPLDPTKTIKESFAEPRLITTKEVTPGIPGSDLMRMAYTNFTQKTTMGQLSFSLFNESLSRILNVELAAMEADGKGKSLSNPRVVTGNNIKAIIEQGDEIPVVTPGTGLTPATTTYKKAKLSLETVPQITPDGRIKMKLLIAKDRPDFSRTVLGNPTIVTAKVETEVLVENGGTLVIGGVVNEDNSTMQDRIPILGDLPYVGFLFKHTETIRERRELLVFITPRIIDDRISVR